MRKAERGEDVAQAVVVTDFAVLVPNTLLARLLRALSRALGKAAVIGHYRTTTRGRDNLVAVEGVDAGPAGYALTLISSGSQGNIEMMVGVDETDVVTGVSIVSNSETPGIGSKVMGNEPTASGTPVLDQFIGKSPEDGTLTVGGNIDGISGATVSSRGVTTGVNAALAVAALMD